MSNSIEEIARNECLLVTGSNTTETHPIIAVAMKAAVKKNGAKLIVVDPRRIQLVDFATLWLQQRPGTDVALFNAMANVILEQGLQDGDFIRDKTENFEQFAASVRAFTPEYAERITGVPAGMIRQAALTYGSAGRAAIYWTLGISEHTHGTDNALTLANLALLTGNLGRECTGLNPLRGQNNVQGAGDMGALCTVLPGYRPVGDPVARRLFEAAWGRALPAEPGLTVTQMVDAAGEGRIKALYIMGEDLLMSEPDLNHARACFDKLEFIVAQDLFITATTEMADVLLPAASFAEKDGTFTNTERRVQRVRKALEPVGRSLPDWEIICNLATRMGYAMSYAGPAEIMQEIASLVPEYGGVRYDRLEPDGIQWPCPNVSHLGTKYLFKDGMPRGKGKFHAVAYTESRELPDEEYPFYLSTGRVLYHWHGAALSRRSEGLAPIYPNATVEIHPEDARRIPCRDGEMVRVTSRRGSVVARAVVTEKSQPGVVFVPWHFREAAANLLTINALDPLSKIPEYKVCAVRVEREG